MSITNLKNINSEELKTLLEKNGIEIKKTSNKHYMVVCISCKKPESYIYFGSSSIVCNRRNECGEEIDLWNHISNYQGLSSNKDVLKYINGILGYQFN
jgi:hypothetical protein